MIAHLKAVKAALEPLAYSTHLVWAAEPPAQYLVLTGRAWDRPEEMPICGATASLETEFRVKAVAGTPEGAGIMLGRVRGVLSPNLAPTAVPMAGRVVTVRFLRSEFLDVDPDTTITDTNRHPGVGVDTYQLYSEPA